MTSGVSATTLTIHMDTICTCLHLLHLLMLKNVLITENLNCITSISPWAKRQHPITYHRSEVVGMPTGPLLYFASFQSLITSKLHF